MKVSIVTFFLLSFQINAQFSRSDKIEIGSYFSNHPWNYYSDGATVILTQVKLVILVVIEQHYGLMALF